MKKVLEQGLLLLKREATTYQCNQWVQYVDLLAKWNKVYNLSGVTDRKKMMTRHILDSLCLSGFLEEDSIQVIADIGTGPGLPGIPLAILFPLKNFILVESRQKRVLFLKQVLFELGIANVEICHGRIETLPVPKVLPDRIISRAFARLNDMLDVTQTWSKQNTVWLAMKGEIQKEELSNIPINLYQPPVVEQLFPPFEKAVRHLVIIQRA